MAHKIDIHYEIDGLNFKKLIGIANGAAIFEGFVTHANFKARFRFVASPCNNGEWSLVDLKWDRKVPDYLNAQQVLQALINKAEQLLRPINAWPVQQSNGGAQMVLNEKIWPASVSGRVIISFRPNMLSIPSPPWEMMWDRILARLDADCYFQVCGFKETELREAIKHLQRVFPASWVKARYKNAMDANGADVGMGVEFSQDKDFWFPSYHLARTALGAICIDPGWNYLVEIGLSLSQLQGFSELKKLENQLCKSPGVRHQLCLAASLFKRGFLTGLEPNTGSGSARSDLLATCNGRDYEIEIKELTSDNPGKRIQREINDKIAKLPQKPTRPVVFHVVLSERGFFEKKKEQLFFHEVERIGSNLPPAISAIVAGRCFVDSVGGHVKRDIEKCILNSDAIAKSNRGDLDTLFCSNYSAITYPMYGLGNLFYFGAKLSQ